MRKVGREGEISEERRKGGGERRRKEEEASRRAGGMVEPIFPNFPVTSSIFSQSIKHP